MKLMLTRIGIAVLVTIVTLSSISCSIAASSNLTSNSVNSNPKQVTQKPKVAANSKLVTANTRFGFKLFSNILKQNGTKNVFVSPASVSIALSMTYNGASGKTKQAMAKALELQDMSLEAVNQGNAELKTLLEQTDPQVQLAIANSLWARKDVSFNPQFIQRNQTFYGAEVNTLDFSAPSAPNEINNWVNRSTRGRIREIVDKINPQQVMFLINAVYFKGKWADEFDKQQTRDRPFYLADGSQKQHPMMQQRGEYRYYETPQFQAVSLPYGKGRTSLYIFLPQQKSNLSAFYRTLTAENWQTWMKNFGIREGSIEIPRFKMEYEIELKKALSALGMKDVFDRSQANFSNLSNTKTYVDEVKHKTFVEVNEEGTEAAAVTSVGIRATSVQTSGPFKITVDRPFFCAIRDNKTGEILFMGSIVNPN